MVNNWLPGLTSAGSTHETLCLEVLANAPGRVTNGTVVSFSKPGMTDTRNTSGASARGTFRTNALAPFSSLTTSTATAVVYLVFYCAALAVSVGSTPLGFPTNDSSVLVTSPPLQVSDASTSTTQNGDWRRVSTVASAAALHLGPELRGTTVLGRQETSSREPELQADVGANA